MIQQPLSVSELSKQIKGSIESDFPNVLVAGEVSNVHQSHAGHVYWTLKDQHALISAVMFSQNIKMAQFRPENGMNITVRGSISVYLPRGTYQIICTAISYTGDGEILLKLEQLKKKLAVEGLFDKKIPVPTFPLRVAVITSPHGAAIKDMLRILQERDIPIHILLAPALVQGEKAATSIIEQLEYINQHNLADLIIVSRGGGSLEDLLPFSDETLVRSIAASNIPVISAVGHETDMALSDFVADVRVPTPTAAAHFLCEGRIQFIQRLVRCNSLLQNTLSNKVSNYKKQLGLLSRESIIYLLQTKLSPLRMQIDDIQENLQQLLTQRLMRFDKRLAISRERLLSNNPKMTLQQGYAIIYDEARNPVYSKAALHTGQSVQIVLQDGTVKGTIDEIE